MLSCKNKKGKQCSKIVGVRKRYHFREIFNGGSANVFDVVIASVGVVVELYTHQVIDGVSG